VITHNTIHWLLFSTTPPLPIIFSRFYWAYFKASNKSSSKYFNMCKIILRWSLS